MIGHDYATYLQSYQIVPNIGVLCYLGIYVCMVHPIWSKILIPTTQISKAIYSPILGQTPKWFRINSFGFITCYRPGSNQFKRNLLFKTYFNSWLWCVNLVDFHFFLKFLNFISISNSQNHLWTLHWRE